MNEFRFSAVVTEDIIPLDNCRHRLRIRLDNDKELNSTSILISPNCFLPPDEDLEEGESISVFGEFRVINGELQTVVTEITRNDKEGGKA